MTREMPIVSDVWRVCPSFQRYEVSMLGLVRRVSELDTIGRRQKRVLLRPQIDPDGYARVRLHNGPRTKNFSVHTLVLTTFHGPAERREANHKNGNRADNRLGNLEWLTHAENIRDTYRNGRGVQQQPGYVKPHSKIDFAEARLIISDLSKLSASEVARQRGLPFHVVKNIQQRRTWLSAWDELHQTPVAVAQADGDPGA